MNLKCFNYWQSCFHKWTGHTYRIESDRFVRKEHQKVLLNAVTSKNPDPLGLISARRDWSFHNCGRGCHTGRFFSLQFFIDHRGLFDGQ